VMESVILEVSELTKYFFYSAGLVATGGRGLFSRLFRSLGSAGKIAALKKVSFSLEEGEVVGLVGPNGAGKTTLLRIIADLLSASSGVVRICGDEVGSDGGVLRGEVGYVSGDERSFFWRLSGRDNLRFFGRLYGLSGAEIDRRIEELLEEFGFESEADRFFRDYSAGMRKQVGLMRCFLHCPRLLLFDEATNNLDPSFSESVRSRVRDYVSRGRGRAAVWSTHNLGETIEFCDRIIALDEGVIRYDGSVAGFYGDFLERSGLFDGFEGGCLGIGGGSGWPKFKKVSNSDIGGGVIK